MSKFENVSSFFGDNLYLENRTNISLRRLIVKDLLRETKSKNIIDIGCGDGSISLQYAESNSVTLIDGSEYMIACAEQIIKEKDLKNVDVVLGDFLEFQGGGGYDIAICVGVFSHVTSVPKLLVRIYEMLSPGGKLIIQFSDIEHFYYRDLRRNKVKNDQAYGYELNTFDQRSLRELVETHNFKVLERRGYSWPTRFFSLMPIGIDLLLLNFIRKFPIFSFMNSEQIWLLEKKITEPISEVI